MNLHLSIYIYIYIHVDTHTFTHQYIKSHPNYSIIEIGQNTVKSPGDLLSLKIQRNAIS